MTNPESNQRSLTLIATFALMQCACESLEKSGYKMEFTINGRSIPNQVQLAVMFVEDEIERAVKEERYEDAQYYKNHLENLPK